MNKTRNTIRTICEIGLFAAVGFVLDELQGILGKSIFVNGGSIGFAFIAVIIIGLRRGWLPALLTGLAIGLFDFMTGAYIIHPVQPILDYIIPYAMVAFGLLLAPLYKNAKDSRGKIVALVLITIVGGFAKLLSHYLAGVIFWADQSGFAWNLTFMNPYLYAFIYNFAFIGPSIVLCAGLMVPLYLRAPKVFLVKKEQPETTDELEETSKVEEKNPFPMVLSIATMVFGTFVFVFYLIKYSKSFGYDTYEYNGKTVYDYDFDPDSMLIFILGLFLVVLGANNLVKHFKNKFSYVAYSFVLSTILFASLIYDISRLIRMYVKGKDPTLYWIWFVIGLLSLAGAATFFVISYIKSKKEKAL